MRCGVWCGVGKRDGNGDGDEDGDGRMALGMGRCGRF